MTTKKARMIAALTAAPRPLTTGEVAAAGGTSGPAAFSQLAAMQAAGLVQRSRRTGRKGRGQEQRLWRWRAGAAVPP